MASQQRNSPARATGKNGIFSLAIMSEKINPVDIALFTRQLATMMEAGVPLVQSFEIVADGMDNQTLQDMILKLRDEVSAGNSFAAAVRTQPRYFDDLFCNLIAAGEQSGTLETMLDQLATHKEKTEALRAKIKSAMHYPIAVLGVATVVSGILLVKVVPQFESIFAGFGAELPEFTRLVVAMSRWMQTWWLAVIIGLGTVLLIYREAYKRSPSVRHRRERLVLKLPVLGNILNKSCIARFSRTLATTFAAGVPLVDALDTVSGSAGNIVYREAILQVRENVSGGSQLHTSMKQANVFPNMVVQMVAVGEESGTLDRMLDKAASYYEDMVDTLVGGPDQPYGADDHGHSRRRYRWPHHCHVSACFFHGRCPQRRNLKMTELLQWQFPLLILLCFLMIGLIIGSFLNVVIYRLPIMLEREWSGQARKILNLGEQGVTDQSTFNLMFPGSHCPVCKTNITPWQNIPVISYLLLHRKCANCGISIPARYPVIELATGLLTVVVILVLGLNVAGIAGCFLTWVLITLAVIDHDTQLLPDEITLPILWLGLSLNLFTTFVDF